MASGLSHRKTTTREEAISGEKKPSTSHKSKGPRPIHNPVLWYGAGVFIVLFFIYLIIVRYNLRGWVGAADSLWVCNISLIMAALGIFMRQNIMVCTGLTATFFAHVLWIIDVTTYLIKGVFPIGNAAYLIWPSTSVAEIFSTLHHAWFIPLCLLILHKNGGYNKWAWLPSVMFVFPVVFVSLFLPETVLLDDGSTFYLNVNMVHGWWKDMNSWPFSLFPPGTDPTYLFVLSAFVSTKFIINYFILRIISPLFISRE